MVQIGLLCILVVRSSDDAPDDIEECNSHQNKKIPEVLRSTIFSVPPGVITHPCEAFNTNSPSPVSEDLPSAM